jgi:acyl-CoA synthetase (AMP-forming)/AMP-acid ligase II
MELCSYKWMTYGEASTNRTAIGSGLIYHGIPEGACIGLYFINRPEWIIVDHACAAYSFVSVPLYDTLGMHYSPNDHLYPYHSSSNNIYVICRSRCSSVHCQPCDSRSYFLCASNTKHCEL